MKKIIIGTQNQAKIKQIAGALANLEVEIVGMPYKITGIEENGKSARENAKIKAVAYSKQLDGIVLSMDNALYIDSLEDERQPKMNVRRIPSENKRPTDDELLKYYTGLIKSLGDRVNGRWEFGICLAKDGTIINETTIISPRIFVSTPSSKTIEGYPLESIQIEPESDIYISEMSQKEQDKFWQKAIGEKLSEFILSII